jgi:hypothetical protein
MSWYNDTQDNFIDATQEFIGGNIAIINEGENETINTGVNTSINDLISLKFDYLKDQYEETNPTNAYNLYIQNENIGGEIRFYTRDAKNNNDVANDALKYNVKIGEDGKLYLYYTYNFSTSAFTTSGWIELNDYVVGLRQGIDNNAAALVTSGLAITANSVRLTSAEASITGLFSSQQATSSAVAILESNLSALNGITLVLTQASKKRVIKRIREVLEGARGNPSFNLARNSLRVRAESAVTNLSAANTASVTAFGRLKLLANIKFIAEAFSYLIGGVGLGGAVVALIYNYFDKQEKKAREEEITEAIRYLEEIQNNPTYQVQDNIHKNGLSIISSTNNNFITSGEYEEINIANDAILHIKVSGNPLIANIENVISGGSGFSVGDVINIPKTQIGGISGNLQINVNSLISRVDAFYEVIDGNKQEIDNIDNRNRRRQFIPDKNDFQNGFLVNEINVTESSGETTKRLSIQLRLDNTQFNYDATGNLQLTNYSQIAQNQSDIATANTNISTNSGNIATNTANIATNTANITTNSGNIATNSGNIATNTANIATNTANIATNTANIATNTANIATNNGNISLIDTRTTSLETFTGITDPLPTKSLKEQIDDIRTITGYDDSSLLYLLLPPNQDGTIPTIQENTINNNSLIHLGYKGLALKENFSDYFILYVMPHYSITTDITNTNRYLVRDLISNKEPYETGLQIQNVNDEYTSALTGYFIYDEIYLSNEWYISIYLKNVLSNFETIYSYNNIEVLINNSQLRTNYKKYVTIEYHYLDTVFTDGLQQDTLTFFSRNAVRFTNSSPTYQYHELIFLANNPNRTLIEYQSIFNNDGNYQNGFEMYPFKSSAGDYFVYHTGSRFPDFQNWVFNISRNWTAGSGFQGAIIVYIRIYIYATNTSPQSYLDFNQIYASNPISLGQQQYQSVNNNITLDTVNLNGYNWWFVSYEYTNSSGNIINDNDNKTLMFGKIKHQLVEYGQQLATYTTTINHNIAFDNNYKHLAFNDKVATENKVVYYVDGVEAGTMNIPTDRVIFSNNNFFLGGLYTYRGIGIGNGSINETILNGISQLSKTNYRVKIPELTVMEEVYITETLILQNNIQFRNQDGTTFNYYVETDSSGSRRRQAIQENGLVVNTFTYTDELIFKTPPAQNQFLFYNSLTGLFEGVNTTNFYTKADIDGFDYLNYNNHTNTPDLSVYQLSSTAFSGSYTDLINKPDLSVYQLSSTAFSGSYTDLINKPDLSVYQLSSTAFSGSYLDLTNTPTLFSGSYTDLTNKPDLSVYQLSSTAFSGSYLDLTNTPTLFSGSYTDLTNKPDLSVYLTSIPAEYITETELDSRDYITLEDIPDVDLSIITVEQDGVTRVDYEKLRVPVTSSGGDPVSYNITSSTEANQNILYPYSRTTITSSSQTISNDLFGNGLYEVTESTFASIDNAGYAVLNNNLTYIGATNQYTNQVYTQNNYIKSDYKGDWIKVKLPYPIKITLYRLYRLSTTKAPLSFRIYGSVDDTEWTQLYNINSANYGAANYIQQSITNSNYYTYYALVVNKIAGSSENQLSFKDFYIYGREQAFQEIDYPNNKMLKFNMSLCPNVNLNFNNNTICDLLVVRDYNATEYNNVELNGDVTISASNSSITNNGITYTATGPKPITFSVNGETFSNTIRYAIIYFSKLTPIISQGSPGYLKYDLPSLSWIIDENISGGTTDYNNLTNKPDLSIYQLSSTAFNGNYTYLTNRPDLSIYQLSSTAFNGNYTYLTNRPDLSIYQLSSTAFNGNYTYLTNRPDLSIYQLSSTAFNGNYTYLTNRPDLSIYQLSSTAFNGNYTYLTNRPDLSIYALQTQLFDGEFSSLTNLPYSIYQMSINGVFNGSYFTLTDTPDLSVYQLAVNAFSGDYNDLTNKPTISTFDGSWYSLTDIPDDLVPWYKIPETYGTNLVYEGTARVLVDFHTNQTTYTNDLDVTQYATFHNNIYLDNHLTFNNAFKGISFADGTSLTSATISYTDLINVPNVYWEVATPDSGIKYTGTIRPTVVNCISVYSQLIRNDTADLHTGRIIFSGDGSVMEKMPLIFNANDYVGIGVASPDYQLDVSGTIHTDNLLYVGDIAIPSEGYIRIARNNGAGGVRSMVLHYDDDFNMCFSDYGNEIITETTLFKIAYNAPANSIVVNSSGQLEINAIKFPDGTIQTTAGGGGGGGGSGGQIDLENDATYGVRTKDGKFRIYNEVPTMGTHLYLSSTDDNNYVNADAGVPIGTIHFQVNEDLNAGGNSDPFLQNMQDFAKIEGVIGDRYSTALGRLNGQLDFYTAANSSTNGDNIYKRLSIKYNGDFDFYNNQLNNINNITFNDGSVISSGLYLYKTRYSSATKSINLVNPTGWRIPTNQFISTDVIYSVGAIIWGIGTNGIIIPSTGYYEITINDYFAVSGSDRGSMISALSINGVQTLEYISNTYVRFHSGDRGSRSNNGVIIQYLTAGDQVCTAWFEVGDSSDVKISDASTFTIKRIG